MWWIRIALGVLTLVMAGVACMYASALAEAYAEIKNKPREPMFWCWRHGMFPKKDTLDAGFTRLCPICYKETWDKSQQM